VGFVEYYFYIERERERERESERERDRDREREREERERERERAVANEQSTNWPKQNSRSQKEISLDQVVCKGFFACQIYNE
jgi:hypothetical protein